MADVIQNELPKPDVILVPKGDNIIAIDFRKKKSGEGVGQYIPFMSKKGVSLDFLREVLGEEFLVSCGVTRYNSALGDWYDDVLEKKGMFSVEEFVKRILSGKLARLKIAEINEQLEEILAKLEAITLEVDAAGGTMAVEGIALMNARGTEIHGLMQEMGRLNNLKTAQKRKKKDEDED
mgnify:FL=1|tara:strand:- start:125 stop:661 length:537 start_codon:yes stop_codon:yes gene_type:complete